MRHPARIYFAATLLLFSVTPLKAQEQARAQPDGWRGLVIDSSTPEDAIRILGQPSGDKDKAELRILMVDRWLSGKHKQKIFRRLTFKKPPGFSEAQLSFLDNKLVMIELSRLIDDGNWLDPEELPALFNTKFVPQNWHFRKRLPPLEEFQQSTEVTLKEYAEIYDMVAISEKSFILARIDNETSRPMGIFSRGDVAGAKERNKEKKARDAGGTLPGQVAKIQIVSRTL